MLNVVNRRARVRGRQISAKLPDLHGDDREVAEGIQKHLDDDRWFHGTTAFYQVTATIAESFRRQLAESDAWRCGFLGHIVMELLLDAVLAEQDRSLLNRYYELFDDVQFEQVESVVSVLATNDVSGLATMLERFVQERFLEDYLEDRRLLFRLNQVMKRINLAPLPESTLESLAFGRDVVRSAVGELLPEAHFPERSVLPIRS